MTGNLHLLAVNREFGSTPELHPMPPLTTYRAETIVVDGRRFTNAHFLGCTLVCQDPLSSRFFESCYFDADCKYEGNPFSQSIHKKLGL